jgi:hypothetical protein
MNPPLLVRTQTGSGGGAMLTRSDTMSMNPPLLVRTQTCSGGGAMLTRSNSVMVSSAEEGSAVDDLEYFKSPEVAYASGFPNPGPMTPPMTPPSGYSFLTRSSEPPGLVRTESSVVNNYPRDEEYEDDYEDEDETECEFTLPNGGVATGMSIGGAMPRWTGTSNFPNGDVYSGEWCGAERHGLGKLVYASGAYYEGDWVDDKRWGFGRMTETDGLYYEGSWENDQKHGAGMTFALDGTAVLSNWCNGTNLNTEDDRCCGADISREDLE